MAAIQHVDCTDAVPRLVQHLYRFRTLAFAVPQSNGRVEASTGYHSIILACKCDSVYACRMSSKPSERLALGNVPQEDLPISADRGKAGVVGRNGDVEDFVAVSGVSLEDTCSMMRRIRGGFQRIEEANCTVCGASEDLSTSATRIVAPALTTHTYWPVPAENLTQCTGPLCPRRVTSRCWGKTITGPCKREAPDHNDSKSGSMPQTIRAQALSET